MSIDPRRQDTSGKRSGSHHKKIPPEEERRREAVAQPNQLLAFTLEATTGKIVKLEGLDSAGTHRELTAEQMADLSKESSHGTLADALERVFEAGIASVLGSDKRSSQRNESAEDAEDAELRQLLLSLLFEHSTAKRLMEPEALRQTILKSLLHDALHKSAEGTSAAGQLSDRAAPSRAN
jgi:hypothetical protein